MEKKKTLILLFMFVFAGVAVLGHTPALATMAPCTLAELDAHTCVYTGTSFEIQQYVMRASAPFDESGVTIFRYEAGVTQEAIDAVKNKVIPKPSAWSYIIFTLWREPLDSDPPGASLDLNQLPNSCTSFAPNHIPWKLNPGVNFSTRNSVFDLMTPLGTKIDQCATESGYPTALIITSSGCLDLVVNVPAAETGVPFQHWAHFTCEDSKVNVNIEFDECTGGIKNVACDTLLAECGTTSPYVARPINPYAYALSPDYAEPFSYPIENMGPGTPGVIVCTGADSLPVYLRGNQGWFCEHVCDDTNHPYSCPSGKTCNTRTHYCE